MTAPAAHGYPAEPVAPQGPGVVPPFASPPTDRDSKRLWISLGIGALLLMLCCAGGIVGVGVLYAGGVKQAEAQARQTVGDYLGALRDGKYATAYRMRCRSLNRSEPLPDFVRRAESEEITSFSVGSATTRANDIAVEATVRYRELGSRQREYLVQPGVGTMAICGER